ncbi:D-inositol-3-phosphate glycosyltransferase domain protein [Mycobacterium xenopi 3993]|nr:D-inositol-3-phosphate glycosyltransferase domain protein [Mycobacterium xenopi 3993]
MDLDVFRPVIAARPGRAGAAARRACGGLRRPDSAAERPDILLRAAAKLPRVRIVVAGGPSGSGLAAPDGLVRLADELGISARVRFLPPQDREELAGCFRPQTWSRFPVIRSRSGWSRWRRRPAARRWWRPRSAAAGGRARRDQRHPGCRPRRRPVGRRHRRAAAAGRRPRAWAMSHSAVRHAARFSWENTVDALLASYRRAISEFGGARRRRSAVWQRRAAAPVGGVAGVGA